MTTALSRSLLPVLAAAVAACATPPAQVLNNMEPHAFEVATNRGRFELQCPAALPTLLSRELAPPLIEGPRFVGISRGLFTIGVSGCGSSGPTRSSAPRAVVVASRPTRSATCVSPP